MINLDRDWSGIQSTDEDNNASKEANTTAATYRNVLWHTNQIMTTFSQGYKGKEFAVTKFTNILEILKPKWGKGKELKHYSTQDFSS